MSFPEMEILQSLADSYGLQTSFYDGLGIQRRPGPESLLAVLKSLGAPLETLTDAGQALRQRRIEMAGQVLEPVVACWTDRPPILLFHLPADASPFELHLFLESGDKQRIAVDPSRFPTEASEEIEGRWYRQIRVPLEQPLPAGYHRAGLASEDPAEGTILISAPPKAHSLPRSGRYWGVFSPVYSLHSRRSWGVGDLSDFQAGIKWVASQGGNLLATLPLYASFLDEPFDPSPYSPVSRFFWNEFFVDPTQTREWVHCEEARQMVAKAEFQKELKRLRREPLVDYRQGSALRRRVLTRLARCFFESSGETSEGFQRFLRESPRVEDYAAFRATHEQLRLPWSQWPSRLRQGRIGRDDYPLESFRYHLYVQWASYLQLKRIQQEAHQHGVLLYLDFPLGVHPDGYDVWREREVFASGVSGGAPPDLFFTSGQNWGFPPLHPLRSRKQGHRYLRECLVQVLQFTDLLRIDHVMSLHRLYWIPTGMPATEGVYVRYPAEELYALVSLESHRHGVAIVGEDLGTVPPTVRETMSSHGLYRMYVGQFEVRDEPEPPLSPVASDVVASLNTHDTPTFAGFWRMQDLVLRREMGLLEEGELSRERHHRQLLKARIVDFLKRTGRLEQEEEGQILRAWLAHLAGSPARLLLINLEDLWLEIEPQNVPGTWQERPNWRRKNRFLLEDLCTVPGLLDTLQEVKKQRKAGENG